MSYTLYRFVFAFAISGMLGCQEVKKTDAELQSSLSDNGRQSPFPTAEKFENGWSTQNTVVCHILGDPDDMHPLNGSSSLGRILNLYLHGYLIVPDPSSVDGFGPGLAQAMPRVSEDGLVYTYKLRDGITWDDKTTLTVDDVIFSYKAASCPLVNNPHYKSYAQAVRKVVKDKIESNTFHIHMTERNIQNVGIPNLFPILQESIWDKQRVLRHYNFEQFNGDANEFDEHEPLRKWASQINDWSVGRTPSKIVGLGPYKFSEWRHDQNLIFRLKEKHWSENVNQPGIFDFGLPETIIFKINRDPNSQALEFKSQTYDASEVLNRTTFSSLINNQSFVKNFNIKEVSSYNYTYWAFNLKPTRVEQKALFTDQKVRRAIAHAIPYKQINELVYGGQATRQVGPVSPLKAEFNTALLPIESDLIRAKHLLAEAGWSDSNDDKILDKTIDGQQVPFKFTLNYTVTPKHQELIAELISESLYKVGIQCELHPITFALLGEKKRAHNFDAFLSAWAMSASAQDFTQIWHTDAWINGGSNYVGFGNAQSDMLVDSIRTTIDLTERDRMSKSFQQLVYDEQPYVFLFAVTKRIVAHKRFDNVRVFNDRPRILLNQWKLLANSVASFDE